MLVSRFPWATDTFELGAEAGIAVTLIGEAQAVIAIVLFIWHSRWGICL